MLDRLQLHMVALHVRRMLSGTHRSIQLLHLRPLQHYRLYSVAVPLVVSIQLLSHLLSTSTITTGR